MHADAKNAVQSRQTPADMNTTLNPEDLPLLVQLTAGLLASGHYSYNTTVDGEATDPGIWMDDFGKGWKEDGFSSRHSYRVCEDAVSVLRQLKREIAEDLDDSPPATPADQAAPSGTRSNP